MFYLKNKRNGFIELYINLWHYTYSVLGEMLIRITSGHSAWPHGSGQSAGQRLWTSWSTNSIMHYHGTVMLCSSSSSRNAPFYAKRTPKSLRSEYLKYSSAAWCFDLWKPNVTDKETVDAVSRVSSTTLRVNTSAIEDPVRDVNGVGIRSASVECVKMIT